MNGSRTVAAITVIAAIGVGPLTGTASQTAAAAAFELPAPTGPHPIWTTSWRLTDRARPETFADPGAFRQVEVIAYARPCRRPRPAPYLREGLAEVHPFARLFGAETAFDGVENVRTHAALDAEPASMPAKFPVLVFSHGYTGMPSSYGAPRGSRQPRLRGAQRRPSLRGVDGDARGRADGLERRQGRQVRPGRAGRSRRVASRGRDHGGSDPGGRRCGTGAPAARLSGRSSQDHGRAAPVAGRHQAGRRSPGHSSEVHRRRTPRGEDRPRPAGRVRPLDGRRHLRGSSAPTIAAASPG